MEEPQNLPLIIGVGNAFRSDDAAGLIVARMLKERAGDLAVVIEHGGDGAPLMDAWRGKQEAILIDATCSGAAPGTILCFDAAARPMPAGSLRYSTHAFGVAEAVEMDRALGGLPRRLTIYGIEGANFAAGEELTAEVESAARHVSSLILEGLNANPSRRLLIGPEPAVQSRLQKPDTV